MDNDNALVFTIGGIAFTTAAILETGYQYGTYVKQPNGKEKYVIPPFYQQNPRFIMFTVGVTFTIGGLIGLKQD